MANRYFQRPENAISKADEFINVGKEARALETLYDVMKSRKRHHNVSEKLIEQIMFKYLTLCVDLRKSQIAKEGLYQYKNMCQLTNVASLASVVQSYLRMAEKKTDEAKQESQETTAEVDDLEVGLSPEVLMLAAVSDEGAQDRSDRKILIPWVKFLWESYCQCLEMLKANCRVERLYHEVAQFAFAFCLKYHRKTEFRKLCDKVRTHYEIVIKQQASLQGASLPTTGINVNNPIDLSSPDTQQWNLELRHVQLDAAIHLDVWQEAYRAVEDIQNLMQASKKIVQPKILASYYQKLALIFQMANNELFHAAALVRHFHLMRESKRSLSADDLTRAASRVTLACLAVPPPAIRPELNCFVDSEFRPVEKAAKLANLLDMVETPTRASLLADIYRFGIVGLALPAVVDLYAAMEVDFQPLHLCKRINCALTTVCLASEDGGGQLPRQQVTQYVAHIWDVTLLRLLQQLGQVYESLDWSRLMELTAGVVDAKVLERTIVDSVRVYELPIRIDHKTGCVHFGSDLHATLADSGRGPGGPHLQAMPSEQIRMQLVNLYAVLEDSVALIHPNMAKITNENLRLKLAENYCTARDRDRQRILGRQKRIEQRREQLVRFRSDLKNEALERQKNAMRKQQQLEDDRLANERALRLRRQNEETLRQIQEQTRQEALNHLKQTPIGRKTLDNMEQGELDQMDKSEIMARQRQEMEKEKRELEQRRKAHEKRVDYFERAKRREEISLLLTENEENSKQAATAWAEREEARKRQAQVEHANKLKNRDRLIRMQTERTDFMAARLKVKTELYDAAVTEFHAKLVRAREELLEKRRAGRIAERRQKYKAELELAERNRLQAEMQRKVEEEARRRAEEEAEARKREEALKHQAEIQAARDRAVEEKQARERAERQEMERKRREHDKESNWRHSQGSRASGGKDNSSKAYPANGGLSSSSRHDARQGGGNMPPGSVGSDSDTWRRRSGADSGQRQQQDRDRRFKQKGPSNRDQGGAERGSWR